MSSRSPHPPASRSRYTTVDSPQDDSAAEVPFRRRFRTANDERRPCRAEGRNVLVRASFTWISDLIQLGFQRTLLPNDIDGLPPNQMAEKVYRNFLTHWERHRRQAVRHPLLRSTITAHFWRYHGAMFLLKLIIVSATFLKPLLLDMLLSSVGANMSSASAGPYGWAFLLALAATFQAVLVHFYFWQGVQNALAIRGSLIALIQQKILRMHSSVKSEYSAGVLLNLCSVDADNIMMFNWNSSQELWAAPITIVVSCVWLYMLLDVAALAGCALMLLAVAVSAGWISTLKARIHHTLMDVSDNRIHLIHEFIANAKLLKLYNWQDHFARRIIEIRAAQNRFVGRMNELGSVTRFLGTATPMLVSFVTFAIYAGLMGRTLDPRTVFPALMLFNTMKEPLSKLPEATNYLVKMLISTKRIEKFLLAEEFEERSHLQSAEADSSKDFAISLKNVTCGWTKNADENILRNINVDLPRGKLIFVVGPVGSGKSTFLQTLLGETFVHSGTVRSSFSGASYCVQQPWILSDTIRNNITFGEVYNLQRYIETITQCALIRDFEILPDGDLALVGDQNGVGQMSGGQRARVSLARAVYANKDVVICDEPLAAVDAHVAQWLFDRVLGPQGALAGKTRIVVTHRIQFAPLADMIVVMKEGTVHAVGTYQELLKQGIDLAAHTKHMDEPASTVSTKVEPMMKAVERFTETLQRASSLHGSLHDLEMALDSSPEKRDVLQQLIADSSPKGSANASVASSRHPSPDLVQESEQNMSPGMSRGGPRGGPSSTASAMSKPQAVGVEDLATAQSPTNNLDDAVLVKGATKLETYFKYFFAGASPWKWTLITWIVIASQAFLIASDTFLATWCNSFLVSTGTKSQAPQIIIYGILVIVAAGLFWIRCYMISDATCRSAYSLHDILLEGVKNARQEFFDTRSTGRILSRFSRDVDLLDNDLPGVVQDVASCSIASLGTVVLIMCLTPASIPFLVPIIFLYDRIQKYYRPCSRDLKRLESASRAPMYSFVGETISGLSTIRAMRDLRNADRLLADKLSGVRTKAVIKSADMDGGAHSNIASANRPLQTRRFQEMLLDKIDHNTCFFFYSFGINRWLGTRLEIVGSLMVLISSFGSLAWRDLSRAMFDATYTAESSSWIALSITITLAISGNLNWMVRQVSDLEVQMNAVERICEFAEIEPEEDRDYIEHQRQRNAGAFGKDVELSARRLRHMRSLPMTWKDVRNAMKAAALLQLPTVVQTYRMVDESEVTGLVPMPLYDPPADWPLRGTIRARNLVIRYRENLPPVLNGVSFEIRAGERVGIVGRTGSGKSTTTLGLFRILQPETLSEKSSSAKRRPPLAIDGLDICRVPLHRLRQVLGIIPQDPVIFSGSMRFNLDPSGMEHSDAQLWMALEKVGLKDWTIQLGGLDADLSGSLQGSNVVNGQASGDLTKGETCLSVGQRQLVCLARAFLRQPRILVADEATASLDYDADCRIKEFLRREFNQRTRGGVRGSPAVRTVRPHSTTILTIAHRLDTILDSDRIMVFDAGRLVEFGAPAELLANEHGYLAGLVKCEQQAATIGSSSSASV